MVKLGRADDDSLASSEDAAPDAEVTVVTVACWSTVVYRVNVVVAEGWSSLCGAPCPALCLDTVLCVRTVVVDIVCIEVVMVTWVVPSVCSGMGGTPEPTPTFRVVGRKGGGRSHGSECVPGTVPCTP